MFASLFLASTLFSGMGCNEYDLNRESKEEPPPQDDTPRDTAQVEHHDSAPPVDTGEPHVDTGVPVVEGEPVALAGPDQEVRPLDTVWLNGTSSYDPQGLEPLTYRWTLMEKPAGSTVDITWMSSWSNPFFFADLAGRYVFDLTVVNTQGIDDSTPDSVTVEAIPSDGFYVQTSWDTTNTDIDLHLINTNAGIFETPDDCCFCNTWPEWGSGGASDNPSLDWDDIDGYGPETTTIDSPTNGSYRILLHFYGENGRTSCAGPCQTTHINVKIYVAQTMIGEYNGVLDDQGQVWELGSFEWPAQSVTVTDSYTTTNRTACQ